MPNPNTSALSLLRNRSATPAAVAHDISKMKTVKIGKDLHPVTIMAMAPVSCPLWQKKSCFDCLEATARNLASSSHKLADVINMMMNEMPSCTSVAVQEAEAVGSAIRKSLFKVENLETLAVIDSNDKVIVFDPSGKLEDRPEDLSFFRF